MSNYQRNIHRSREKNVTGTARVSTRGNEENYRKVFPRIDNHADLERNMKTLDVVPNNKSRLRETIKNTKRARDYQNVKSKQPEYEIDVNVNNEKPLVRQKIRDNADYVSKNGNMTIKRNGNSRSKRK